MQSRDGNADLFSAGFLFSSVASGLVGLFCNTARSHRQWKRLKDVNIRQMQQREQGDKALSFAWVQKPTKALFLGTAWPLSAFCYDGASPPELFIGWYFFHPDIPVCRGSYFVMNANMEGEEPA